MANPERCLSAKDLSQGVRMLSRAIADFSFFSLSMLTHWVFPKCRLHLEFLVVIPRGIHPFPSRTRKLSPAGPMILHGQLCGNVGRRQDKNKRPKQPQTASAFFVFYRAARCLLALSTLRVRPCQPLFRRAKLSLLGGIRETEAHFYGHHRTRRGWLLCRHRTSSARLPYTSEEPGCPDEARPRGNQALS